MEEQDPVLGFRDDQQQQPSSRQYVIPVVFETPYRVTNDALNGVFAEENSIKNLDALLEHMKKEIATFMLDNSSPQLSKEECDSAVAGLEIVGETGGKTRRKDIHLSNFVKDNSVVLVREGNLFSRNVFRVVTGIDRMERKLDLVLLERQFREAGTTDSLAIDDVWKTESEKIREVLVSHLRTDEKVFDAFQQIVCTGAKVREHHHCLKEGNHEPYEKQQVDIILADIRHFFDAKPEEYSMSQEDHTECVHLMREVIQSAVTELFADVDISVDVFLSEGHEMSNAHANRIIEAHPVSAGISPKQRGRVLDLLDEGIKLSMFPAFPNLVRFAVKNARSSLRSSTKKLDPYSGHTSKLVWRKGKTHHEDFQEGCVFASSP